MDDNPGVAIAGALIVGVIVVTAVFFVLWIVAATLLKVFAVLIMIYYPIGVAVAIVAGLIAAIVVLTRCVATAAQRPARTLTPADVADHGFFDRPPRGESRHFGWDRAWPRYAPFQARRDIEDAVRAAGQFLVETTRKLGSGKKTIAAVVTFLLLGLVPYLAFVAAFLIAYAVLTAICVGFLGLVWLVQFVAIGALRGFDLAVRKIFRLSVRCVSCYQLTPLPSYKCSNCTHVHRDLRPGRLGVLFRRCECSAVLPTTVTRASGWALRRNIICPSCDHNLPEGTGSRQTIQIPTFGSVGVGKTRLLFAAIVGLHLGVAGTGTKLTALSRNSADRLQRARDLIESGAPTLKTPVDENPEALGVLVEPPKRRAVELHLLDAAGERFTTSEGAVELRYLHSAETLLFVIDPFSTAEMRAAVPDPAAVGLVVGVDSPEDSYSATVEQLRSNGLRTSRRGLGIVVTKADDLRRLGFADGLDAGDEQSIHDWLVAQGLDNVTTRARQDFARVRYFLTDAMGRPVTDPEHPVHVLDWLTRQVGVSLLPDTAVPRRPVRTASR